MSRGWPAFPRSGGPDRFSMRYAGALLLMLLGAAPSYAAQPILLDTSKSRIGFEIQTRFGQRIEGVFPRFEGRIEVLPDGRHQIQLRLFTHYVEIPGKPRYTSWMRGEDFFDAAHHPVVSFESVPVPPELVKTGGSVDGVLSIRGIKRAETLRLAKPECERPGYDCDVSSRGVVSRGHYGMDKWQIALGDRVTFLLHTRLIEAPLQ